MKVGIVIDKLTALDLIDGFTKVIIRDEEFNVLAEGFLPDDGIAAYKDYQAVTFCWEDGRYDNKVFIDIESCPDD